MSNSKLFNYIDTLKITKSWKKTFKKIHTVYYNNYNNDKKINPHLWGASSEYNKMSFKSKANFFVNFNFYALLMGPFYYLEKRIFKKGAILFAIFLLFYLIGGYARFLLIPLFLYCSYYANRDVYIHTILEDKNIKNNALYLNAPSDSIFITEISNEPYNYKPLATVITIICLLIGYKAYKIIMDGYLLEDNLNTVPIICNNSNSCTNYILDELKAISSATDNKDISDKYYLISIAYMQNHDIFNSINALNISIKINPKNVKALYLRGELCYQKGNYVQSAIDFKDVLKMTPNAHFVNFYIGRSFYKLHLYNYASKYFSVAAKKYNKPEYYEYWGYSEINDKKIKDGVKAIKKAISLYKKDKKTDYTTKIKLLEAYISKF